MIAKAFFIAAAVLLGSALAFAQLLPALSIADAAIKAGETYAIPVVLDRADNGLAGYELTLAISGAGIAEFSDVLYPELEGVQEKTEKGKDRVVLSAVDTANSVQAGAENVLLAYVVVMGKRTGTAQITMEGARFDDDNGNGMGFQQETGTIVVETAQGRSAKPPTQQKSADIPLYLVIIVAALLVSFLMLVIHWHRERETL